MENIRQIMQATYPAADLSRYFAFLAQATGSDHKHHIAPRAEFPELLAAPENIVPLGYQEHFYAHYLLALAVPECGHLQMTFYMMANFYAKNSKADEMPFFAEVYERGMQAQAAAMRTPENRARVRAQVQKLNDDPAYRAQWIKRLNKLNADPTFTAKRDASARERLTALNADPAWRAAQDERSRKRIIEHKRLKTGMYAPDAVERSRLGRIGHEVSQEARAKIGTANRIHRSGTHLSEETKQRQSASIKEAFKRPAVRENHRLSLLGHETSQATRDKISAANKGQIRSEKVRAAIRRARAKQVITAEHAAAIGAGNKRAWAEGRRTVTQEQKDRFASLSTSEICKARWANPEYREKMMLNRRGGRPRKVGA